jgi:tRNA U34 5-methylaminomethyl-2-thiouridine-forming methyltransferase MnmC
LKLHEKDWDVDLQCVTENFAITKCKSDIVEWLNSQQSTVDGQQLVDNGLYDVVYFDAFSPDAQPELWSEEVFGNVYALMKEGGVLMTYCAKGDVRRAMLAAGFGVEKLQGPPGKRHILRARK